MYISAIPRPEYPRPQMVRGKWINLNGLWNFEIDNGKSGKSRGLLEADVLEREILVPFCPESRLSGIGNTDFMDCVWYKRRFSLPKDWISEGRKTLLHIGACDYQTEVWINGKTAGAHIGGYSSFSFDITALLNSGENKITICAEDNLRTGNQPSGKQCHSYHSDGCYYTRTTGIWQTVWLENVANAYIAETKYIPCLDRQSLIIEATCCNAHGRQLKAEAFFNGKSAGTAAARVVGRIALLEINLNELHLWSNEEPNLYTLNLSLGDDEVESYFGMREITYNDGKFFLNGRPVFQRLILDQGYYPDTIYTAPTDEALATDIRLAQSMGFNGARLHQKVFEPSFLYHCDKMGYLVWGEQANWGLDLSRPEAWQGFLPEWLEILKRDFNHPAIVGWSPLNETQSNQNRHLIKILVDMTHAFDGTRPVIDASGWTHQDTLTDILDVHDYEQNPETFSKKFQVGMQGEHSTFVSEYGGIWWSTTEADGWGYGDRPKSREEVIKRYQGLTEALLNNAAVCAFCYTQLTDVEQEKNGLYTYDRKPKFDPEIIATINSQKAAVER